MVLNSIQVDGSKYVCAALIINTTSGTVYPGIAHSTDSYGLVWTLAADTGYTSWASSTTRATTDYLPISAARGGSSPRVVCLSWRESDNRVAVRYSDDDGANWNDTPIDAGNAYFTGSKYSKVKYENGQFIVVDDDRIYYGNGATLTTKAITGATALRDIAYGDSIYVAVENDFQTWYATTLSGTWTNDALPIDHSSYSSQSNFIVYDALGERHVVNSDLLVYDNSDPANNEWNSNSYPRNISDTTSFKPTNLISDITGVYFCVAEGGAGNPRQDIQLKRFNYTYWDVTDFVPLSDIYRSASFSVLDGYVVLVGTYEWDSTNEEWTHYPRRIRWTVPQTYNNFDDTGSGTADANGEGAFLDSRPVNGRIVIFETNRVSSIVPRGDTSDPWDFDIVKEDFRILSNPVVVNDICYVIGTDGLLYLTDGITLQEGGSAYDATKYDDYTEDAPITLDYSSQLNSLFTYHFDEQASSHYVYFISLSDGQVTRCDIPEIDDSVTLAEKPAFVTAVGDSPDQRIIASYHPQSGSTDVVTTTELAIGSPIAGKNVPVYGSSSDDTYYYGTIETGEIYLVPEGIKTSLKHIIIKTYTEDNLSDNSDRPRVVVFIKSLEDSEWHIAGGQDDFSTYVIDTSSALPGSSSATGAIYAANTQLVAEGSGSDVTVGDSVFPTGIKAIDCAYFTLTSGTYTQLKEGSGYTLTDNGAGGYDVTILAATLPTGTDLYASWNNYPEIKVETGDFYVSDTLGLIRVTGTSGSMLNDDNGLTFDRYLSSGTEDITVHYPSVQLPSGYGETKIGVNKLVEGFKLKILVVPEYGQSSAPTTAKVTGITFGHIPRGRKILSATGS